jgi:putative transposase
MSNNCSEKSKTSQLDLKVLLAMTSRVPMLGVFRWTDKGGSYQTVQYFFGELIFRVQLFRQFFVAQLHQSEQ